MKYVEMVMERELEELLHDLYIEQDKSVREIGEELDVHYHTINKWLKMASIDVRLPHEKMLEVVEIRRKLMKEGK